MSEIFENKLKLKSVAELENIIAKAISEATGENFEATISTIDFSNKYNLPEATFSIKVHQPSFFEKKA